MASSSSLPDPPDSTLTFLSPLSLLCQDAHSALAADPAETIDNTGVGGQEDICCGEPETPGTEPEPAFFLVARIQEAVSFQDSGREDQQPPTPLHGPKLTSQRTRLLGYNPDYYAMSNSDGDRLCNTGF